MVAISFCKVVVQSDVYLGYGSRKWKADWAGREKPEVSNNKKLK